MPEVYLAAINMIQVVLLTYIATIQHKYVRNGK